MINAVLNYAMFMAIGMPMKFIFLGALIDLVVIALHVFTAFNIAKVAVTS